MREHVVAASKAMKMGDWRTCHTFIINEKMNSKVWDLFPETQRVREMLVRSGEKKKKDLVPFIFILHFFSIEVLNFILSLVSVRQENPGRVTENLSFHIQQCV